jgi:pimeloyl-ACP methyl ester carboxylesterase
LVEQAAGVAAAILDSVLPPDIDYLVQDGENLDRSLKLLEQDCRNDPDCASGGPGLRDMVKTIVEHLDQAPVPLRREAGKDGKAQYKRVTGDDFLDVLYNSFYDRDAIETLPALITSTYGQDYRSLADAIFDLADDGEKYFDGMDFSVTCHEAGLEKPRPHVPLYMAKWASQSDYNWICPLWTRARPQRMTLRGSSVPTLLLSGEYDPTTPAVWARHAVKSLRAGQSVEFRGIGHDVIDTDDCGADVVADFLADPGKPVRTACIADLKAPAFSRGND